MTDGGNGGNINRQLADYLKSNFGASRLMKALKGKYRSFGRFSGIVNLELTQDEADFLNGLMKKHYRQGDKVRLSAKKFLAAFEETRFKGADFLIVCQLYFGSTLETKKSERWGLSEQRQEFFRGLQERHQGSMVGEWLEALVEGTVSGGTEFFNSLYKRSARELELSVEQLAKIQGLLSKGLKTSLPILAAEATKNPHALDNNQNLYRILLYFLSYVNRAGFPGKQEEVRALLNNAGIRVDVGTRNILTYGFKAESTGGGKGWERFWEHREPLVLTMRNLDDVIRIRPADESSQAFAFENPAVFTRMAELEPERAYICTSGQLNMLDHHFLRLLLNDPSQRLYYSGDYDPEGLLIADKLWSMYPEQVKLFGYEKELYYKSVSDRFISEKRLQQLANLENPQLLELAEEIRTQQKAGYQEYVIDGLRERLCVTGPWHPNKIEMHFQQER